MRVTEGEVSRAMRVLSDPASNVPQRLRAHATKCRSDSSGTTGSAVVAADVAGAIADLCEAVAALLERGR